MTAVRQVYLICNGGVLANDTCESGTNEWDANNAREARRIARRLGWIRTPDGRDLCSSCKKKLEILG